MFHIPAHKNVEHPAGQVALAAITPPNDSVRAIDPSKWPAVLNVFSLIDYRNAA